ncbi:MAG: hypothetical protein DRJ52_01270 [Thermoprotei archaeon]|nr:MAG: hypothetical protein DRJ52_01270 [Thermoprotei archaeon]RLF01171.1 MAG: hypothetical protein DRJ63_00270 [Thermoprotei archaeon]HDI74368.1 hypothetical protein [Thermoprotei archaeon]
MSLVLDPYILVNLTRKFYVRLKGNSKEPKIARGKYLIENSSCAEALREALLNDNKIKSIILYVYRDRVKIVLKTVEGEYVHLHGSPTVYEVNTIFSTCKLPIRLHKKPGPVLTKIIRGVSHDVFYLTKLKPSIIKLIAKWAENHPGHRIKVYCWSKRYAKIARLIFCKRRNVKIIFIKSEHYRGSSRGR